MNTNVHVAELAAKTFERSLDLQIYYTADDYDRLQEVPQSGTITFDKDGCKVPYYSYKIKGDADGGVIHIQLYHLPALDGLHQIAPQEIIGMVHSPEPDLSAAQHTIGMGHAPAPTGSMIDEANHRR